MRQDDNLDFLGFFSVRKDFPDLRGDILRMYQAAAEYWGESPIASHFEGTLGLSLDQLKALRPGNVSAINRVYVTTEYFLPCLIASSLPANVISATKSNAMFAVRYMSDESKLNRMACGQDAFSLWLFQGADISLFCPITPTMAAEMLTAFGAENLISLKRVRPHWCLNP